MIQDPSQNQSRIVESGKKMRPKSRSPTPVQRNVINPIKINNPGPTFIPPEPNFGQQRLQTTIPSSFQNPPSFQNINPGNLDIFF